MQKRSGEKRMLIKASKWLQYMLITALSGGVAMFSLLNAFLRGYSAKMSVQAGSIGAFLGSVVKGIGFGDRIVEAVGGLTQWDLLTATGVFAILLGTGICILNKKDGWLRKIYQKRWWIGGAILLFFVVFELHNSSLYYWSYYLQGAEGNGTIWGRAQMIRSDEWAVWTPFAISQSYNGYAAFNNQIAGGSIDTTWISVGGIPALNSAIVFKPLYWGFLLLDTARGLSFLNNARWIMLFGVSFACAKQYTGNRRSLSIAAAALLTWAPYVQWWFSQSIAEVLIFGQLILLCLDSFLRQTTSKRRWLLSIGLAYCVGCYVMIGYPSWLIAGMYLIVGTAIWMIIKHRNNLHRVDIIRLLIPLLASIAYLIMIVCQSWDTLQAVANSVYPGERLIKGGKVAPSFYTGLYALTFPFLAPSNGGNASALSGFICFAPAGLLLTFYRLFVQKQKDTFAWVLLGIEAFFGIFLLIGVSPVFAKLTLLSQCNRAEIAVAMVDIILLFRGLAYGSIQSVGLKWGFTFISVVLNAAALWINLNIHPLLLAVLILVYALFFALIFHHRPENSRLVAFSLICLMLMAGSFVNPIQKGLDCVTELKLVKALNQMQDENDDMYAFEGDWPVTNAPLLAGKRCWNSTQAYPNIEKWKALDPSGEFENIYNRFCHISLEMVESHNTFVLVNNDHIKVSLTGSDLIALGIDYLITAKDYSMGMKGCQLIHKATADVYNIYEVKALD